MIQRKQSLFLFLSVLLFVATYYFPIGKFGENELHNYTVQNATGEAVTGINNYYFAVPMSIAALITVVSIFLYGNRKRQMAIVRLTFILFAATFALLALYVMSAASVFSGTPFSFGIAFFLPFACFFLNLFALRGIMKDEKLVKSVDRIR